MTNLRQKTPKNSIAIVVTLNAANNVIGVDIF
jgi:hypothetical protein